MITGIAGQDGSYLAELLLEKGYEVHGIVRRNALENPEHYLGRLRHILDDVTLHAASLESYPSLYRVVQQVLPDECYHLAAQSFVSFSFDDEYSTLSTNISGTHHMLSAVKEAWPSCRFFFASSSESFGKNSKAPQDETTPFHPRSAYGISKVAGFELTRNYREAYRLFACSGIMYNHESPRRGYEFVTRKITSHAAKIASGRGTELRLGDLNSRRDWGHAKDYVRAAWLMLQQDRPEDYVLATGVTRTVREFCQLAFSYAGLDYRAYVVSDPKFFRPLESDILCGNATKALNQLGWKPAIQFEEMVQEMVDHDLAAERHAAEHAVEVQLDKLVLGESSTSTPQSRKPSSRQ